MAKEEHDIPAPAAPTSDAVNTAVRHQVYLERVGSHVSELVRDKATRIGKSTVKLINELDAELADLSTDELGSLLVEARVANTELMLEALGEMTTQLEQLALYEQEFSGRALGAITRKVRIRTLKSGEAYKAALENPMGATGELLEDFTKGWSERQVKSVGDLVAKGYTNGLTNQQIVQSIRGTKAANFTDGIVENIGRNTDAVVRTSIQHIAGTARDLTWAKNSDVIEGEQVVATLDSRTTPQCRSLDGRIFPLGKGPKFPIHIRCRTTKVPVVAKEFDFLNEGSTRSSENGYVSADLTYYQWLKQQPVAFQDDAIGPTRAKLLRDGGLSADEFARLNLGRNFQPLTLDEMRKKEPNAFEKAGL